MMSKIPISVTFAFLLLIFVLVEVKAAAPKAGNPKGIDMIPIGRGTIDGTTTASGFDLKNALKKINWTPLEFLKKLLKENPEIADELQDLTET